VRFAGARNRMADWGAIVRVNHEILGARRATFRVLDELLEELSAYGAIAGSTEHALSVRLFVTASDRASAMDQAMNVVLATLRALEIPHDADSACILALDPIKEFERDFPAPE
jgi:hypothetical protein